MSVPELVPEPAGEDRPDVKPGLIVNFFDFDRTITRTDTIKFLLLVLMASRPFRIPRAVRFFEGRGGRAVFSSDLKHEMIGMLLKGRKRREVDAVLTIYTLLVKMFLRKEVAAILRNCHESHEIVLIGTASPEFAVKAALAKVAANVEGTRYELEGDRFTGKLTSPVCIGEEKLRRIRAWLADHGCVCIEKAYSDHHSDLPILRLAKRAVFVYPDPVTAAAIGPADEVIGAALRRGSAGLAP